MHLFVLEPAGRRTRPEPPLSANPSLIGAGTSGPALRAMIWMRRLNILPTNGPGLARERRPTPHDSLGPPVGRLAASIARQQAFAAVADRDRASFLRYAAHAVDVAETEPAEDDHAIYAIRAYVAAEVASGLIAINQPAKALELLLEQQNSWQPASSTQRSRFRGSTGPSKSVVNTNPLSVHSTSDWSCGLGPGPERVFGVFRGPFLGGVATTPQAMLQFCII